MQVHYFQRYHQKENVMTANTLLLLSRLYNYSSEKFYRFLQQCGVFPESLELELHIGMQERKKYSVPDADISQTGFNIVVETKREGCQFNQKQLFNHLRSFRHRENNVLLTLSNGDMTDALVVQFIDILERYNRQNGMHIYHKHITFAEVVKNMRELLEDRDYEMQDILDDYEAYCYDDGLISKDDAWQYMRMQLAGHTFNYNVSNGVYYDSVRRGFRPHAYLGLYTNKSIRAIGEIDAIITNEYVNGKMEFHEELGHITEERKHKILDAIDDSMQYGYRLDIEPHRFFFVDKFYKTDYRKASKYAPMGSRIFDLTDVLQTTNLPPVADIAKKLTQVTWQ